MGTVFRNLSVADVDRFIQFPETINVDARGLTLTVEEDTLLQNYSKRFRVDDYAVYASISLSTLFNSSMDWNYNVLTTVDPVTGVLQGPNVCDAYTGPVYPIINVPEACNQLGTLCKDTRFTHYRQCNRFFRYSYRVGDPLVDASGRKAQLFAVYLDTITGIALPYWESINIGDTQDSEQVKFFYADLDVYDAYNVTLLGQPVRIICPPHPEFLESKVPAIFGGNMGISKDASCNIILLSRGILNETTNIMYEAVLDSSVFEEYRSRQQCELLLYWVVNPKANALYHGESMHVAYCSKAITLRAVDNAASWGPIRDLPDASGILNASQVKPVHRFIFTKPVSMHTFLPGPFSGRRDITIMHFPVSKVVVHHKLPLESDISPDSFIDIPFSYDLANETSFGGNVQRTIMGARIMQLVSVYMFDSASDREMSFFSFLGSESSSLTGKIIVVLADALMSSTDNRNIILQQLVVKYGKRYFDEMAVFKGTGVGSVWEVLCKLDEFFITFTASITTTISTRNKNDLESVQFVEVPFVLHVKNNTGSSTAPGIRRIEIAFDGANAAFCY